MQNEIGQLNPGQRILLGPGPVEVSPRVLRAMSGNMLGHLDPQFLQIMNETMELIRFVYQTRNQLSVPISGTGSSGMETVMVNLIEPGDKVIICVNGVFGQRMRDMAGRCGAEVISVEAPWGQPIDSAKVRQAFHDNPGVKLCAVVHAETSTGVLQPLEEISHIVKQHSAMIVVDAVTSLGGIELKIDDWGIDACYSGTQKALSCPPGLSPVTFNEKAAEVISQRKIKVQSWYLDLSMIRNYWGKERVYHHTAPINMIYGLREALLIVKEEGLKQRFARHKRNSHAFISAIEAMGLSMVAPDGFRLPTLNAFKLPQGMDDLKGRKFLLEKYGIEVGAGLGDFKGTVWRIGLMGESSRRKYVMLVLCAIADAFAQQGHPVNIGAALEAAMEFYNG